MQIESCNMKYPRQLVEEPFSCDDLLHKLFDANVKMIESPLRIVYAVYPFKTFSLFSYDAHERRLKATIDWGDLPVNWSPKAFRWEFDFVFTPDFVELESGTEKHFSKDGKMIKEYFYPDQPYMRLGKMFIFHMSHCKMTGSITLSVTLYHLINVKR